MEELKKGIFPFNTQEQYDFPAFNCGRPELDDFLKNQLIKQQQNHILRAYLLLSADPVPQVMGYYTLSGGCYTKSGMSNVRRKQVLYRDAPCILLGRLAVDVRLARRGFGTIMVADAARRVDEAAQSVGVCAMIAEAKDEDAGRFYMALGFIKLNTESDRLVYFYPTNAIEPLIALFPTNDQYSDQRLTSR